MFAWVSLDHMSSGWKFTIISVGSGLVRSAKDLQQTSIHPTPLVSPPTLLALAFFLSLFVLLAFGLHFYHPLSDFIYVPVSKSLFFFFRPLLSLFPPNPAEALEGNVTD